MNISIHILLLLFSIFFFSKCGDATTNAPLPPNLKDKIKKDSTHILEQKLFNRIKEYNLNLEYLSYEETAISDKQIAEIIKWGIAFSKDTLFNSQSNFNSNFIIQIEGLTTLNISKENAIKRTRYIETRLNKVLGSDAENIPIFKTLKSLKYGKRKDNYVELSINRLSY
jgi:hypothetical protein